MFRSLSGLVVKRFWLQVGVPNEARIDIMGIAIMMKIMMIRVAPRSHMGQVEGGR